MPLPLYRGLNAPTTLKPPMHAHPGLWFERYFNAYDLGFNEIDKDSAAEWLRGFENVQSGQSKTLVNKAVQLRQMALQLGGRSSVFSCDSRFVTGIGNAHPIENGMSWHPTLGTPYLSGSQVKGIVRAVIDTLLDAPEAEKNSLLKRWFGTEKKDDVAEQAGELIFFDAIPVSPCVMKLEIMAPHMGKWYEKGGKDPLAQDTQPGDWHSPVPVKYLVANKISLQFSIAPRTATMATEMDDVWQALAYGLNHLGAGAKTAIGFGIFHPDEKQEKHLQEELEQLQRKQDEKAHALALSQASESQQAILALKRTIDELPANLQPNDKAYAELMSVITNATETLLNHGSKEEKEELYQLINSNKGKKFPVSKAKEKDFKASIRRLTE